MNIEIEELLREARDSLDALLYWVEKNKDIPKNIYAKADKTLYKIEKLVPFPGPFEEAIKYSRGNKNA